MANNKWQKPAQRPPSMFIGEQERNFVKQINDEIIEGVVGQTLLYYAISLEKTNFHPLYGEAIEKTFLPPIRVYARVVWSGYETETTNMGIDRKSSIIVHFHKRRLTEDQDLFVREGDFVLYGDQYYEIVTLNEPKQLFGQVNHKMEIEAKAIKARHGNFNNA